MNISQVIQDGILNGNIPSLEHLSQFGDEISELQGTITDGAVAIIDGIGQNVGLTSGRDIPFTQPENLSIYAVEQNLKISAVKFDAIDDLLSEMSALQFRSIQLNSAEGLLTENATALKNHGRVSRGEAMYPLPKDPKDKVSGLTPIDLNKELARIVLRLSATMIELKAYSTVTLAAKRYSI